MEEVSLDELEAVLKAPEQITKPTTTRKKKVAVRDQDTWYFKVDHTMGEDCENPECVDPRNKPRIMTAVVNGKRMCRFCFLAEWNMPS